MKKVIMTIGLILICGTALAMGGIGGFGSKCGNLSWGACHPNNAGKCNEVSAMYVLDPLTNKYKYADAYKDCGRPAVERCFQANGCQSSDGKKYFPWLYS